LALIEHAAQYVADAGGSWGDKIRIGAILSRDDSEAGGDENQGALDRNEQGKDQVGCGQNLDD